MPIFKSMTRVSRVLMPVAASVFAAGCSADVARFDVPASAGFSSNQTSSIPIPPANVYGAPPRAGLLGDADGASHQPPMADSRPSGGDVRVAELPPTQNAYDSGPRSYDRAPPSRSYDSGYDSVSAKPYDAAPRRSRTAPRVETAAYTEASGDTVEVKQGDTLYSLSRQHGVKVNEIMAANDLKHHSLKPGQRLTIPSGSRQATQMNVAMTPPPAATATPSAAPADTAAAEAPADAGDGQGTYTMKPGDSLYTIARQHKVNYAELQQANGITDANVRKIRPGTVLKIPAASSMPGTRARTGVSLAQTGTHIPVPHAEGAASRPGEAKVETVANTSAETPNVLNAAAPASAPAATPSAESVTSAPAVSASEPAASTPAAPAAAETKVAAIEPATATDAAPAASEPSKAQAGEKSASTSGLRWPVQGRIISQFGPRPDGTHNDGVNLSVPLGTDVHAAESGEVIYVGDELKAYGKLVLLRHDNGWVTAYAHNEDLLVTRGKKVARGDVIAKAGKTGPVDQPQVHFELRQDSKAVDPTAFMEKQ